jgi:cytochrome c5
MKTTVLIIMLIFFIFSFSCKENKTGEDRSKIYMPTPETETAVFTLPIKESDIQLDKTINQNMSKKGKAIFLSKCKVCHYLGTEKLTGPGFKNITKRRSISWIMSFMVHTEQMLNNDPVAKNQKAMFNISMPPLNLSFDDARNVLEFMRQNDN